MKNYRVRIAATSYPEQGRLKKAYGLQRDDAVVVEVSAEDETAAVGRVGELITRLLREEDEGEPNRPRSRRHPRARAADRSARDVPAPTHGQASLSPDGRSRCDDCALGAR